MRMKIEDEFVALIFELTVSKKAFLGSLDATVVQQAVLKSSLACLLAGVLM